MSSRDSWNDRLALELRYLPTLRDRLEVDSAPMPGGAPVQLSGIGCIELLEDLSRDPAPSRYNTPQARVRLELRPGHLRLVQVEMIEFHAGEVYEDKGVLLDWSFERFDALSSEKLARLERHLGGPFTTKVRAAFADPACLAPEGTGSEVRHRALLESLEVSLHADDTPDRYRPYVQVRLGTVQQADHFELLGPPVTESADYVLWLGRRRIAVCQRLGQGSGSSDGALHVLGEWPCGPNTVLPDAAGARLEDAFGADIGGFAAWFAANPDRWFPD